MKTIWWLASYPKSGNTWVRLFLANYRKDDGEPVHINHMGGHIAASREMFEEFAGVDSSDLTAAEIERCRPRVYRGLDAQQRQALFLKVHDAWTRNADGEPIFPAEVTAGVIYIVRNPLDVAVSYGHHSGRPLEEMVARLNDEAWSTEGTRDRPSTQLAQRFLSWSGHVRSWIDTSALPVLVTRYEDLLAEPPAAFTAIVRFAGLPVDPERLRKALEETLFDRLQAQEAESGFAERRLEATRPFFGQGRPGGWRSELSPALAHRIIEAHRDTMRRFGYLDEKDEPEY